MTDAQPEMPYDVMLERILTAAKVLTRFAEKYMDTPADDTSPDERRQLAEVDDLLQRALDRFQ